MKKKNKKFLIPSLLLGGALLCASASIAFSAKNETAADVTVTPVTAVDGETYAYGARLEVPACTFDVDGTVADGVATVIFPDGKKVRENAVTLDQSGVYTLSYYANVNGKPYVQEYTFYVEGRAVEYAGKNTQVSYGRYKGNGANSDGLIVRLESGDKLTFPQLIDMETLDKNTPIVKGFVTPDAVGIADFTSLVFTFTDAENPDITLTVNGNFTGNVKAYGLTYFTAAGNGQVPCGEEYAGKVWTNDATGLGTPILHSFVSQSTGSYFGAQAPENAVPDAKLFSFSYDNATRQVWAGGKFVSDLDSVDYYSAFWLGFPSGKAKLSISAKNYAGLTANFCLTEVLGADIAAPTFSDNDAPVLTVENEYESMPMAQVGGSYPVAQAAARDEVSGVCDVSVSAWYNYASTSPVMLDIKNGRFETKKAGTYAIVYEAKDYCGNVAKEILWVRAEKELPALTAALDNAGATETKLGELTAAHGVTVSGASGNYTVEGIATCGDEVCRIEDGVFRPEKAGTWTVAYTARDYIGRETSASYQVTVTANDTPVFVDAPVLPAVMIAGTEYTIPQLYANDYSSGSLVRKLCDVEITDENGVKTYKSGDKFIPSVANNGDEVSFVYSCGNEKTAAIKVPTVKVWTNHSIFGKVLEPQNYFYGENILTQTGYKVDNTTGIKIEAATDAAKSGFRFANAQKAEGFALVFKTIVGAAGFTGLDIRLTDSQDPTISILAKLEKADGKTKLIVDGTEVLLNGDFDAKVSQTFNIGYQNNSFVINGSTSLAVGHTEKGERFGGFPSGKVYFDVYFNEVEAGSAYMLYSVNGGMLNNRTDSMSPSVAVLGSYGGNYSVNDVYEFAAAVGCDIHAPNVALTMSVTTPDGKYVTAADGTRLENVVPSKAYKAKLTQYGTYKVSFVATEESWQTENSFTWEYTFNVVDEIAPTITFKGGFQTTAVLGDTLYIPEYEVSDNYSKSENLEVIKVVQNPNGAVKLLTGNANSIECLYVGTYEFRILVVDEAGNSMYVTKRVVVTETAQA